MLLNKDSVPFGLLLGFLAPVFGLFGYYYWKFSLFSLNEFFQVLLMQKSLLSGIIAIALIANAIVFTVYINKQKDKTAKGVFIATCIYALISLGIKWFV